MSYLAALCRFLLLALVHSLIPAGPVLFFFFFTKRRTNAMKHILKTFYCIRPDKSLLYLFIKYSPVFKLQEDL